MGSDRDDGRKIVMHPKTAAARHQDRARVFGGHVRGYTTETDEVLALLRAQRRLSLGLLAVVVLPVFSLPLLFRLLPGMSDLTPIGPLPLPWLLLGPVAPLRREVGRHGPGRLGLEAVQVRAGVRQDMIAAEVIGCRRVAILANDRRDRRRRVADHLDHMIPM